MELDAQKYIAYIKNVDSIYEYGKVTEVIGLTATSRGPRVRMGEICHIYSHPSSAPIEAEVVGFREEKVLLMPLDDLSRIAPGSLVRGSGKDLEVRVGSSMLGKVLNGLGKPLDDSLLSTGMTTVSTMASPPNPLSRPRITEPLGVGIRAIDGLLTLGKGQRVGIFAGSGVGKSTLLGMIARNTSADVNVIALIGERGREVRDFLERDLGEEGLRKSVLVVATSDTAALQRIKGAFTATAIAEYFRDQGKNVMLMMDSVTRFAMAQREIGLAVGEPPTSKGYTPSVFALLPKLLERAGNAQKGSITAFYTVLVDGDDLNEPIADSVRGILDGHIVLDRKLAQKGRYPAINVLSSISRVMNDIVSDEHLQAAQECQRMISVYESAEDLIQIGAYKKGSDRQVDEAIRKYPAIAQFLTQDVYEPTDYRSALEQLWKQFGKDEGS